MSLLFYSCIHIDCYIHIHILHFLYQYLSGFVCRCIFLYISYKYLCTFIHIGINVHMLLTPLQAYMYTYVYFEKKKCIHMLLHLNITSTYWCTLSRLYLHEYWYTWIYRCLRCIIVTMKHHARVTLFERGVDVSKMCTQTQVHLRIQYKFSNLYLSYIHITYMW